MRAGLFNRIAGLKFFNVYGPGEDHKGEMRARVPRAFHQARGSGEIALFNSYSPGCADGEQTRDFIHVDDAAAVALFFLDHPECSGLFNFGTGRDRTWLDPARVVLQPWGASRRSVSLRCRRICEGDASTTRVPRRRIARPGP